MWIYRSRRWLRISLFALLQVAPAITMAQKATEVPSRQSSSEWQSLSNESWKLFSQGLLWPALDKGTKAYSVACESFPEGSWQRRRSEVQLQSFERATKLTIEDRQELLSGISDYEQQLELLEKGMVDQAAATAEKLQALFDRLLGAESYLAVRQLSARTILHERLGDTRKAHEIRMQLLSICQKTRAKGDPELIVAAVTVAEDDMSLSGKWVGVGPKLLSCMAEAKASHAGKPLEALVCNALSNYYFMVGMYEDALKVAHRQQAISSNTASDKWRTVGGTLHYIRCLARVGRLAEANNQLTLILKDIELLARLTEGERRLVSLIRAEVLLRQSRFEEAEAVLESAIEKGGMNLEESPDYLFLMGQIMQQTGRLREAEVFNEKGLLSCVRASEGEHPNIVEPLTSQFQVKMELGKRQEASELENRCNVLRMKIKAAMR